MVRHWVNGWLLHQTRLRSWRWTSYRWFVTSKPSSFKVQGDPPRQQSIQVVCSKWSEIYPLDWSQGTMSNLRLRYSGYRKTTAAQPLLDNTYCPLLYGIRERYLLWDRSWRFWQGHSPAILLGPATGLDIWSSSLWIRWWLDLISQL